MTLWWIIAAIAVTALVPLLWPLLRPPKASAGRLEHDLEVYRDQLAELRSEHEQGSISEQEAAEARREIERRILRVADKDANQKAAISSSPIVAVVIAVAVPALSVLIYASLGAPTAPDAPTIRRAESQSPPSPASQETAPSLDRMIQQLADRLAADPDDVQGWTLLGRAYWETGKYGNAADAYGRAVALNPDDPALQVAYGEAVLASTEGRVTPVAKAAFERAFALDETHIGARYYLGVADLQAGRPQYAYDRWLALARELPANSDARRTIIARLERLAGELEIDLAADLPDLNAPQARPASPAPGPTREDMEAAKEMSSGDRQAFIRSMVQRLADRLEESPDDFDGWMRLGRAYGVLGETEKSSDAYGRAADLRPDDPSPLELHITALIQAADRTGPLPVAAVESLRRLQRLQPDNPRVLWYLGLTDAQSGDNAAALQKWRRLRGMLPEGSEQQKNLDAGIADLERR
jgi:cytochrome c-type biogenesis protein CcmH